MLHNTYLIWAVLGVQIACMIPLLCLRNFARKVPANYILLFIFTAAEAYLVGFVCIAYDPTTVMIAAVMTLAITVALTAYACLTKTDFTIARGAMVTALFCLILLSFMSVFMQDRWWEVCISAFGVFIYGMFIIIDTQMIADGKKHSIDLEDYIIGALMLYIDIIGMFLELLRLMGDSGN